MDSEALNQVFLTAKAKTFSLCNEALKSHEEAVERNILLEERVEDLEQHNALLSGNLESLSLRLEEVTAEKLSSVPTEEYVTNTLAANKKYKLEVVQLRTHLGMLSDHIKALQDSISRKQQPLTFLTHIQLQNPPSNLTPSLNKQLNNFKRNLKRSNEEV